MNRAIVFDLDGTLVDSVPGIVRALARAFAAVVPGHPLPDLAPHVGPPVARMIPAIAPHLPPEVQASVLAAFRRDYDAEGWREVRPCPGAVEVLTRLEADGVCLLLATYKPLAPTRAILAALDLARFFRAVRCVDGPGAVQPEKHAMIRELLGDLRPPPTEPLYVGDTAGDEAAAQAAGVAFAGVGPAARFSPGARSAPSLEGLFPARS